MKKFLATICAAVLVVGVLAGCGATEEAPATNETEQTTEETTETTEEGKVYVIATDTTFAPFEFQAEDGSYVGIDMDLLAAIAEDQGFEYELQVLGFSAAVTALEAQQVDGVIAGMSITDARKEIFDFSEPYFDSGVVMGIAADNETITSYEDLRGQKVAVKTGTEGADFANSIAEEYELELVYFDDSAYMYEDVKLGNTVACFEDYPVLGYGISQNIGLKIVTEKEQGSSYGFAVSKGLNPELIEMFNAGLANLQADGTYQTILDTYIAE